MAFSTAGGDTAAALASGCPVVFKAHPGHMATAEAVAEAILRAAAHTGMPAGVFNMVYGGSVGAWLVKHPAIQAVGFTGSLRGGRALCDMAAARPQPIPVFAEMSSINPIALLPVALQARGDKVAQELAASVLLGAGQFCTNPGLVIGMRSPAFDTFLQRLCQAMDTAAPQTMLNAGGLAHYGHGVQAMLAHPGVTRVAGAEQAGAQARAQVFKSDARLLLQGDPLLQEEIFGPATVVVEVPDRAELVRALHALRGQLTATLIGEPDELGAATDIVALLQDRVAGCW